MVMMVSWFAAEEGDEDVDAESDESCSDESFADGVHVLGEADMEKDDGCSEDGDGEGVA